MCCGLVSSSILFINPIWSIVFESHTICPPSVTPSVKGQITLFHRSAFGISRPPQTKRFSISKTGEIYSLEKPFKPIIKRRGFDGSLCHGFSFAFQSTVPEKKLCLKRTQSEMKFTLWHLFCARKVESEWKGGQNYYMSKQKVSHFKYTLAILLHREWQQRTKV